MLRKKENVVYFKMVTFPLLLPVPVVSMEWQLLSSLNAGQETVSLSIRLLFIKYVSLINWKIIS